uniref:Auxin responsive protein n=1 Tax=Oryza nivara TaxID=4536 RepID=A0A0E0H605_ORYNI
MGWRKRNDDGGGGGGGGAAVPRGCVALLLVGDGGGGGEEIRVVVEVRALGQPRVGMLLERAAGEYGYDQEGVLRVPCSADEFRRALAADAAAGARGKKKKCSEYQTNNYLCGANNKITTAAAVPRGCVALLLVGNGGGGDDGERVVVEVRALERPRVGALLEKAAREFGYDQKGVLRVPCSAGEFRQALTADGGAAAAGAPCRRR